MELVRLDKTPLLFNFAKKHLPISMRVSKEIGDYGYLFGIVLKKLNGPFFGLPTTPIARIDARRDLIEVFSTNYVGDIQDLVEKYESLTGRSVEVQIWESKT